MDSGTTYLASRVRQALNGSGLRHIPPTITERAGFGQDDSEFLQIVGVPAERLFEIDFNLADRLPSVNGLACEHGLPPPKEFADATCMDEHYDIVVAVDVHGSGHTWLLDLRGGPRYFINSNIRFFIGSLAEAVLRIGRRPPTASLRDAVSDMRAWLSNLDPPALEGDTWWAVVLQQVELGTL